MTRFSSDILLPFPNSNDLNSRVGIIYLLKKEAVVVKPPEWTFITIILALPDLSQKWQKN